MSDHAMLSPSSAYRWSECPGSVALSIGAQDRGSAYAEEGTKAHDIAAACLSLGVHPADIPDRGQYAPDFWASVEAYVEYVKSVRSESDLVLIEQPVPIDHITGEHEAVGTVDCIVDAGDVLHVIDYKHGQGVLVPAEDNLQLVMYASGYIYHRGGMPREINLHIVQPRRANIAVWTVPPEQFDAIVSRLLAAAERVWDALQDEAINEAWQQKYLKPGGHCKFCKALPTCPAVQGLVPGLNDALLDGLSDLDQRLKAHIDTLDPEAVSRYLGLLPAIDTWMSRIRDLAAEYAGRGELPGYKLVAGRAYRRWSDETAAVEKLRALGLEDSEIFETKLRSVAEIERQLGKAKTEIADLITRPQGRPVLAEADDPRPEYTGAADFDNLEDL